MEIEKAKEILKQKEDIKKLEEDAIESIRESEATEKIKKLEAEKEAKKRQIAEWKKKIPSEFCKSYTKCWKCNKQVELDHKKAIQVVEGHYRIVDCPNCNSYIIENLTFRGAINMDELLPYCLKLK